MFGTTLINIHEDYNYVGNCNKFILVDFLSIRGRMTPIMLNPKMLVFRKLTDNVNFLADNVSEKTSRCN